MIADGLLVQGIHLEEEPGFSSQGLEPGSRARVLSQGLELGARARLSSQGLEPRVSNGLQSLYLFVMTLQI